MENKRQFVKILSVSFIILIALILFSICFNLVKGISLKSQKQALQSQLNSLQATIEQNKAEIEYKQSADYTDRYAREYLDMNSEDEKIYKGVEK